MEHFPIDTTIAVKEDSIAHLSFRLQRIARVSIRIDPSIAEVLLDGERQSPARIAGLALRVGEHKIHISAQGYQSREDQFRLAPGDNSPLTYRLNKIPGPPITGGVSISSDPSDAVIFWNDVLLGNTPYQNNTVQPGIYRIVIRRQGFRDYSTTLNVSRGQIRRIEAKLIESLGSLNITSQPSGATIYLDGRQIGSTPYQSTDTKAGDYKILLRKEGYEDHTISATVETDRTSYVQGELKALMGGLSILVRPYGSIYIDGELREQETNIKHTYDLQATSHVIRVEHPVIGKWEKMVQIKQDALENILVDFTKKVRLIVTTGSAISGEIFVDSKATGQFSPKEIILPVGLHTIGIRRDGYEMEGGAKVLNLDEDMPDPLVITLRKIQ
jgi:hypothetical protein